MKRYYLKLLIYLRGESKARMAARIRRELSEMGYESAWTNWHFQAREKL